MPVVHVRGAREADDPRVRALVEQLPGELERAADLRPGGVWCTYGVLVAQSVGGRVVGHGEAGVAYVDVRLRPRDDDHLRRVLAATARIVARELEVPLDDVWASVQVVGSGQVFAGGRVLADGP